VERTTFFAIISPDVDYNDMKWSELPFFAIISPDVDYNDMKWSELPFFAIISPDVDYNDMKQGHRSSSPTTPGEKLNRCVLATFHVAE